jgi:hypothetical protein
LARPAEIVCAFNAEPERRLRVTLGLLRVAFSNRSAQGHDVRGNDNRAVIANSLASKLKRDRKFVKTDFAIVLTVANREIVRFQMLEARVMGQSN